MDFSCEVLVPDSRGGVKHCDAPCDSWMYTKLKGYGDTEKRTWICGACTLSHFPEVVARQEAAQLRKEKKALRGRDETERAEEERVKKLATLRSRDK